MVHGGSARCLTVIDAFTRECPAIVNAINAEVLRLLQAPDMYDKLTKTGLSDWPLKTPEEFAATVRNDLKEWGDIVRKGNI